MTQKQINSILTYFTQYFKVESFETVIFDEPNLYTKESFVAQLQSQGEKLGVLFIEKTITKNNFENLIISNEIPHLFFSTIKGEPRPFIILKTRKGYNYFSIEETGTIRQLATAPAITASEVTILTPFLVQSISAESEKEKQTQLSPVKRLFSMLSIEKRDIFSIYIYALLIGAISLVLPLGIQAIIGLVQGGVVFSSIYILIGLVIVALFISGVMQIMQLTLVEFLQERLFAKAAFDYTYRIPKIKTESLNQYYPPELVNRFFDIITVQKTLPKILIDVSAAIIQIIFGLILLAAYHPLFIGFTFVAFLLVFVVVYLYGNSTLEKNIYKSKYKYKVAQWLQEIARSLFVFKVTGDSKFHFYKMEQQLAGYLKFRKKYFDNLLIIFYNAIFFKVLITGGLLIMGTYLVIDRQITVGQFVASEIVIVLVVGAVEKILLNVDSIFDLLTAVDKLGFLADLPLEKPTGKLKPFSTQSGVDLKVKNLYFKYLDEIHSTIDGISFSISAGEKVCITGVNGSGKDTLLNLLASVYTSYTGSISYNGISVKDIEVEHFKENVEKNVSSEGIFDGTILENITMNRSSVQVNDVINTLKFLELDEQISSFSEGLNTQMVATGRKLSNSFITKITIARCLVNHPKFIMLSNCFENFDKIYLHELIDKLFSPTFTSTVLVVSNDPYILKSADKILVLNNGKIALEGSYEQLKNDEIFKRCLPK